MKKLCKKSEHNIYVSYIWHYQIFFSLHTSNLPANSSQPRPMAFKKSSTSLMLPTINIWSKKNKELNKYTSSRKFYNYSKRNTKIVQVVFIVPLGWGIEAAASVCGNRAPRIVKDLMVEMNMTGLKKIKTEVKGCITTNDTFNKTFRADFLLNSCQPTGYLMEGPIARWSH